jgi:DNA polymerase-3 subunit gamma/tau
LSCREISQGTSLGVREIDGASHNSVDNVRELIDSFRSPPPPESIYKVYIIDEVHMLSISAFNALLKSLEEPPPHTVFILATTEVHKIPATVLSRCQRHDFRALPPHAVESCLKVICEKEGLSIEPEALRMVARLSDGSMRDAQSLLERLRAFCEDRITSQDASSVLGTVARAGLAGLLASIVSRDAGRGLSQLSELFSLGVDTALFLRDFAGFWRDLLIAKFAGKEGLLRIGYSETECDELLEQVKEIDPAMLRILSDMARDGADAALRTSFPKYAIEALVVRLATWEVNARAPAEPSPSRGLPPRERGAVAAESPKSTQESSLSSTSSELKQRAEPSKVVPPPKNVAPSPGGATPPSNGQLTKGLSWNQFVAGAASDCGPVLADVLQRIAVSRFEPGYLEARGARFSIQTLERAENREKLIIALTRFAGGSLPGVGQWKIKFETAEGNVTPGSLKAEEQGRIQAVVSDKKRVAADHDAVKSIKKAFPGSTIDSIRAK